jgi:hypothetical protein
MRTLCACCLTTVGLVLAGTAIAQVPSVENPRVSRHCTGATLNTDPTAPCADDVLRDRPEPAAVRSPSEPLPAADPAATSTQPLPGAPNTSGGITPGTAATSGGVTPGVPNTSVGTTPGTPATSVGSTPGSPTTSGGTTPGVSPSSAAPPGSPARTSRAAAR